MKVLPPSAALKTGLQQIGEVAALLSMHADKLTEEDRQRLVRHGHLPERQIMTGIGPVAVRCPRMRDRVGEGSVRAPGDATTVSD